MLVVFWTKISILYRSPPKKILDGDRHLTSLRLHLHLSSNARIALSFLYLFKLIPFVSSFYLIYQLLVWFFICISYIDLIVVLRDCEWGRRRPWQHHVAHPGQHRRGGGGSGARARRAGRQRQGRWRRRLPGGRRHRRSRQLWHSTATSCFKVQGDL